MKYSVFCVILLLCQTTQVQSQILTTSPSTIVKDLTNSFLVNCTFNAGSDPSLVSLTSLTVSRSLNFTNLQYQVLSSVDAFSGVTTPAPQENLTTAGVINNSGQSFLSLYWDYPLTIKQGVYQCDATGLNSSGQPLTLTSSVNVTDDISASPEVDLLKEEVVQLRKHVDSLENEFQNLLRNTSSYMNTWSMRLTNIQKTLFETSAIYNNSQYFLYKETPSLIPGVAEATCQIYGGHLAEIGDSDEYDYIIRFVERFSWVQYLLVGGSQLEETGNWVYSHSNTSLEYFRWASAYPWANFDYNCLVLSAYYNWNMTNQLCTMDQSKWPIYYLCEVTG